MTELIQRIRRLFQERPDVPRRLTASLMRWRAQLPRQAGQPNPAYLLIREHELAGWLAGEVVILGVMAPAYIISGMLVICFRRRVCVFRLEPSAGELPFTMTYGVFGEKGQDLKRGGCYGSLQDVFVEAWCSLCDLYFERRRIEVGGQQPYVLDGDTADAIRATLTWEGER